MSYFFFKNTIFSPMNARRILLFPVSLVYGFIIGIRTLLYDIGLLKPIEVNVNTIGIGNLSVGGTGKTPHVEYIVELLQNQLKIAILSRGYGRKSSGYILAEKSSTAQQIGDEPAQYIQKFDSIVAVCENRVQGIHNLLNTYPDINLVILDDVFQHRKLKVELNIALTDYNQMYYNDFILPSGNLREFKTAIKRADAVVVTKSPMDISPYDRRNIELKINPKGYQKVFFSHINYLEPVAINEKAKLEQNNFEKIKQQKSGITLFTGIANASPIEDYLRRITPHFSNIRFGDHHHFSENDLDRVKKKHESLPTENKIIITTEKDYNRLADTSMLHVLESYPLYYLPIKVEFNEKDKEEFNQLIIKYATRNKIYIGAYKK